MRHSNGLFKTYHYARFAICVTWGSFASYIRFISLQERFIFKYLLSVSILFYYATLIISIVYVVFLKKRIKANRSGTFPCIKPISMGSHQICLTQTIHPLSFISYISSTISLCVKRFLEFHKSQNNNVLLHFQNLFEKIFAEP